MVSNTNSPCGVIRSPPLNTNGPWRRPSRPSTSPPRWQRWSRSQSAGRMHRGGPTRPRCTSPDRGTPETAAPGRRPPRGRRPRRAGWSTRTAACAVPLTIATQSVDCSGIVQHADDPIVDRSRRSHRDPRVVELVDDAPQRLPAVGPPSVRDDEDLLAVLGVDVLQPLQRETQHEGHVHRRRQKDRIALFERTGARPSPAVEKLQDEAFRVNLHGCSGSGGSQDREDDGSARPATRVGAAAVCSGDGPWSPAGAGG